MKIRLAPGLTVLLGALLMTGCRHQPPQAHAASPTPFPPIGTVERLDPALDQWLSPDANMEKLAAGFEWSEGPVWVRQGRYLLFSDIPNNVVLKWKEGEGISTYLKPSGYTGAARRGGEPGSNGLALDPMGRLVLCEHGDRRVSRLNPDGSKTTLASQYHGKRLNSPNDLVYKSNGDLYFSDPPYGLEGGLADPAKELPFQGVYRLKPNGELTLLTDSLTFPNGLAFSPDENLLYVAVSDPKQPAWMVYDVQPDGTLANGRLFFDAKPLLPNGKGLPDGLKVDQRGNLFATGPGGVLIISPQGHHLGTLRTGEATANCAWGDDGSTLYITADMYLCRIRTKTRGTGRWN